MEARLEAMKELAKLSADATFATEFINMEGISMLTRLVESGTKLLSQSVLACLLPPGECPCLGFPVPCPTAWSVSLGWGSGPAAGSPSWPWLPEEEEEEGERHPLRGRHGRAGSRGQDRCHWEAEGYLLGAEGHRPQHPGLRRTGNKGRREGAGGRDAFFAWVDPVVLSSGRRGVWQAHSWGEGPPHS